MSEAADLQRALSDLMDEILLGAPTLAFVLNPGDTGLLQSIAGLSAEAASAPSASGGASIAAHVDHLLYGIHLLNRWAAGEDPWDSADYSASWRRGKVTHEQWVRLRDDLRAEANRWRSSVRNPPREMSQIDLTGMVGSIVHLAYHLGAIRQINPATRGPRATGGLA